MSGRMREGDGGGRSNGAATPAANSSRVAVAAAGSKRDAAPQSLSAPASAKSSLLNLLRSDSSSDVEKRKANNAPKGRGQRNGTGSGSASAAAASSECESASSESEEAEAVSPTSGASSTSSKGKKPKSRSKRSTYTQKLIHLSNSFRNLFTSAALSATGASASFSLQSTQHAFTNSPAWVLGRVHKLLGPPPSMHGNGGDGGSSSPSPQQLAALQVRRLRFARDHHSQLWMTYRRGFSAIGSSSYTSDAGWGCMIRSAQMLLAQVQLRHFLGREWRRPTVHDAQPTSGLTATATAAVGSPPPSASKHRSPTGDDPLSPHSYPTPSPSPSPQPSDLPPLPAAYLRILSMFLDSPSAACPYSIHNLLVGGDNGAQGGGANTKARGSGSGSGSASTAAGFASRVGEWFGPHNACWMVKQCMETELARLQAKIAAGRPVRFGQDDMADGFGGSDSEGAVDDSATEPQQQQQQFNGGSDGSSAAQIPAVYSVPKIYVSDDGTLYLDKIMQLARGQAEPSRSATPPTPSPPPPQSQSQSQSQLEQQSEGAQQDAAVDPAAAPPASQAPDLCRSPSLPISPSPSPSPPPLAAAPIPSPNGLPSFTADFHPLLILIPLRLGVDKLNPCYIPSLLSLFQFPQCVGVIGGKPRSSLYFIGVQDERLFYLDPHTVQKAADLTGLNSLRSPSLAARHAIADTYHCTQLLSIPVTQIDPSLALGFYIDNQATLDAFWEQAKQFSDVTMLQAAAAAAASSSVGSSSSSSSFSARSVPASLLTPIPVFHVADVSPNYSFDDDDDDAEADESAAGGSSSSGSEVDEDPDADADEEQFASARAAAGAEAEAEAERERDRARSDSPVDVSAAALPRDAQGRPLSMDSLTSSPVMCARDERRPADHEARAAHNDITGLDLADANGTSTAAADHGSADHSPAASASASATLSGLTYAAARSLSSFTASVASSAQQQLAAAQQHIAHSAAQLQMHAAAAAAAARRTTVDGAAEQLHQPPADIDATTSAPPAASDSAAAAAVTAASMPAAPAASSRSAASSTRAPLSKSSSKAGRAARRRNSRPAAAADDDEFVLL